MAIIPLIVMIADRIRYTGLKSTALGLLVALSIILRLFGPAGTLPQKDGYVAICLGAEVVYLKSSDLGVPADDGQDGPDDDSHKAEPCIWFSSFHAVALVFSAPDIVQSSDSAVRFPSPQNQRVDQPTTLSFHARGPPHLSQLSHG